MELTPDQLRGVDLFRMLGDEALAALAAGLEQVTLAAGEPLFRQGDPSDALYVVLDGLLQAVITHDDGSAVAVGKIGPGKPVGEIQVLAGGRRTASVHALLDTRLARLSRAACEGLAQRYPDAVAYMARMTRRRLRHNQLLAILPRLFGALDEAQIHDIETRAQWVTLHRGEALFHQGEPGDSFFIVISGRLQAVVEDRGRRVVGEVAPGESVGEMAIFTGQARAAGIYAIRDSVLVKFSKAACDYIMERYPQTMLHITRVVIRRLSRTIRASAQSRRTANIAVVAASADVPLTAFAERLSAELAVFGPALHLNSARLDQWLETPEAAQTPEHSPHNLRLSAWLDEHEAQNQFVVYEADPAASPWTRRCIRQADEILLVAWAQQPVAGDIEAILPDPADPIATARRILVLLHPDGRRLPLATGGWLERWRPAGHHHLRWDRPGDLSRLARFLTGHAIGLVLGGGGARGFAHIGVFRAFAELGVPIDMIGGTSMGAVISSQYAMGWDEATMMQINRKAFLEIKPFQEYTLPMIALLGGRKLDHIARMSCGDTCIEDLWTNYFCISSNLTTAEMVVHRQGPLWRAVRASASIPGIANPVLEKGHLLVDGGLLNNLPCDVMRQLCGGIVIAVDVGVEQDLSVKVEVMPTPWELLWTRALPFREAIEFPNILDVLWRTTLLASEHRLSAIKQAADLYLRPPVERFGLLEFKALPAIVDTGYQYAREALLAWQEQQPLARYIVGRESMTGPP
ncbi:MAG: patatin-like phospholipase domain-containing protein [Pseudomonadota bacterium]|nr:patatin-like phospholipase domain-containing protein [Pseudomonadota bacterium]